MKTFTFAASYLAILLAGAAIGWGLRGGLSGTASNGRVSPAGTSASVDSGRVIARESSSREMGKETQRVTKRVSALPARIFALQAGLQSTMDLGEMIRAFELTGQLTLPEIPEALALGSEKKDKDFYLLSILLRWSDLDPAAATEWAAKRQGIVGFTGETMVGQAIQQWAGKDPAAARQWIESRNRDERLNAWPGYFNGLSWSNPQRILPELRQLESQHPEDTGFVRIGFTFRAWGARDPQSAMREALSSTNPLIDRESLVEHVFRGWGSAHPAEALDAVVARQSAIPGSPTYEWLPELVEAAVKQNPKAGLTRLLTLPTTLQNSTAAHAFEFGSLFDLPVAESLVEQLPPGPAADAAKAAVLKRRTEVDDAAARDAASQQARSQ